MEFLVEKVGMSRTVSVPSVAVTLLKVKKAKVCELKDGKAIIAYNQGKFFNKSVEGQQKKYNLSKEYNKFATVEVAQSETGELDLAPLGEAKEVKVSLDSKGRGFSGVIKRWNFSGGPGGHGSRFHRRTGSIGNREHPGRVQPGKKMAGHYGNEKVTVVNGVISFDVENQILVVKGSVPGSNGALGRLRIAQ